MIRLTLLFALSFAAGPAAAAVVPLAIGDTELRFPVADGYVRASERAPAVFRVIDASLPRRNRLVEAFYTPADIDRMTRGERVEDIYYTVQTLRVMESTRIGIADWQRLLKEMSAGMTRLDPDALADDEAADRHARLSAAAGQDVELTIGETGVPQIYRVTPTSLRFGMTVPASLVVAGKTLELRSATAGAIVLARNKAVYVYASASEASPDSERAVRAALDVSADRLIALNPSDPGPAVLLDMRAAGEQVSAFVWRRAGAGVALLGLAILLLGLVPVVLARRRRRRA